MTYSEKLFRYISEENLSSADGLAKDEVLIKSLESGISVPTLHLYNYKPSVIVGLFQNLQSSIRMEKCEELGIEMNRRCSGGGTVFMSPEQLAAGFALPNNFPGLPKTIKGLFEFLAEPLSDALQAFGVKSQFEGKNDLQVNGKKIAGLAISQDSANVTFFHVSLLLDFNVPLMLEILNLPTAKFLDRGISCFGERMTTLKKEIVQLKSSAGSKNKISVPEYDGNIDIDTLKNQIRKAFEIKFNEPFYDDVWTSGEEEIIKQLKKEKYENEEWIFRSRSPKKQHVYLSKRTQGGLLNIHISFTGEFIETILLTGDYFSRTKDIFRLESVLRWTAANRESLKKTFNSIYDKNILYKINEDEIISLILEALEKRNTKAD